MSWFAQLGQNAAGQAVSGGIALGLSRLGSRYDRKQQLRAQTQMMGLQMQGEKEMMEYQQQKQLEMWEKTGYSAQVEQMKKAGLNPALMYGMGGGGGQTIGGGVPQVSGGNAPYVDTTTPAIGMGLQMNAQLQLMNAQKENIEADTANKLGDTANKPLVGKNLEADTKGKEQQVLSAKAQQELTEIQAGIARIDEEVKGYTQNGAKALIMQEVEASFKRLEILNNQEKISDATVQDTIKQIKAEAIGAALKNALTKAQTKNTTQDTEASKQSMVQSAAQIQMWVQNNMREWDKMNLENRKIRVQEMVGQTVEDNAVFNQLFNTVEGIMSIRTGAPKRNPIGFK